ncbi:MAG: undecaprenyldiphospho-muramoylpentapeptide beta-N-acetylglucosaminyltransferase [Flavobacteriaceae bacterium]|jgi:UDP-N-acetylglucosamine--N-acetylmuramyl-(pentapeptide) pyrophosphoryl-undecaprenol N-acetylglucosamine transferase|nr:undecaprenyldiphospho-muramoylpentapeptide beta-N-acetylglucosaminyltransferase [Flavobacteriaceae bacterium]MDC3402972.1 undecaprenyldiphospho-muramoylpentapeptide beta-N-acetylglucosaminyltransferase [Flavobacteriaceae bacterium]PTM07212.1 MAG: undecaprenyldiphospho-muramoylpentapeptide beta-N-acetylglucosaminyltransferase [Bacteroidota bacterium]
MNYRFLISGGGTGGHIYPAIAIADELKATYPDADFLFVGAQGRMEMELVPKAGYPIKGLWITGIQRKFSLRNLLLPVMLLSSLLHSFFLLLKFKPDYVVGTGGFASGPLLFVASILKIPYLIQEQNAFAGLTNKWVSPKADIICVAYPNMDRFFPKSKVVITGNPIRSSLIANQIDRASAASIYDFNTSDKVVLMLGGSLGSAAMNKWLSEQLNLITSLGFKVLWQCGKIYYNTYKDYESKSVKVVSFIENMGAVYELASGIISRAGAGAISELAGVGKPTLFIPSPLVAEDHQTKNAESMVALNAAMILRENEMSDSSILKRFLEYVQSRNQAMGNRFKAESRPRAAETIVQLIAERLR